MRFDNLWILPSRCFDHPQEFQLLSSPLTLHDTSLVAQSKRAPPPHSIFGGMMEIRIIFRNLFFSFESRSRSAETWGRLARHLGRRISFPVKRENFECWILLKGLDMFCRARILLHSSHNSRAKKDIANWIDLRWRFFCFFFYLLAKFSWIFNRSIRSAPFLLTLKLASSEKSYQIFIFNEFWSGSDWSD